MVYNVAYTAGKTKFSYIKSFAVTSLIKDNNFDIMFLNTFNELKNKKTPKRHHSKNIQPNTKPKKL